MLGFVATPKLLITLVCIVALMRLGLPMGAALVAGSVVLGFFFGMPSMELLRAAWDGLWSAETVFLLVIVTGLLAFTGGLNASGQIQRIIDAFTSLVGKSRLSLVTFPALIGLLPMPGGAVFSAPMVDAATKESQLEPHLKSATNYWFRHLWEYWLPLYPGVILTLTLTGVSSGRYILMQMPMTLISVAWGYVFLLRSAHLSDGPKGGRLSLAGAGAFLSRLFPIFLVVGSVLCLSAPASLLARWVGSENILLKQSPMVVGLLLGAVWLLTAGNLSVRRLAGIAFQKRSFSMLFLIVGLMIFRGVLADSGAVGDLSREFDENGVPFLLAICLAPFICGLVVGVAVGFVGTSFPLVLELAEQIPEDQRLPWYVLAYIMGYAGMMISPVHICLVLTNEYFSSGLLRVYKRLVPLMLVTALSGLALFLLYDRLG